MEKVKYEVGAKPRLCIDSVGGDLRISGHIESELEIQAPQHSGLKAEREGDLVTVTCRSGCLIFTPGDTRLEVDAVGGDARLTGIDSDMLVRTVGGNLVARRIGRLSLEQVGGDVRIRKVLGGVNIDKVGGDAHVERIEGDLRLCAVGGDVLLREGQGEVQISCGGDAQLEFTPETGGQSRLHAGGDVHCQLPAQVSVKLIMRAGGNINLPTGLEAGGEGPERTAVIGAGEAQLELNAGGDLSLSIGPSASGFMQDIVFDVMHEVDAKMAEVEARLGSMSFDSEQIGERVRQVVAKAQEEVNAELGRAESAASKWVSFHRSSRRKEPVTEDERLAILRMVEQGIVTVDEGEALLSALEEDA